MRYAAIFALSGLLGSDPLLAQPLFDIGLKGGANWDDLTTHYAHEGLLGANLGLFTRVKAPFIPGVQGEVMLTSIGSRVHAEGYTADIRSAALQVPLFLILAIGPVELHGGGYYEYYLSKKIAAGTELEFEGQTVEIADLSDDGFGLLAGAGVRLGHFYAGARYNMGLDAMGSGPFLSDVSSRQIQAYLGFGFMGKGKSAAARSRQRTSR